MGVWPNGHMPYGHMGIWHMAYGHISKRNGTLTRRAREVGGYIIYTIYNDGKVYLERELSAFGATTSLEESAFLGAALLHCANLGFLSCVQLLLARSAPLE